MQLQIINACKLVGYSFQPQNSWGIAIYFKFDLFELKVTLESAIALQSLDRDCRLY